MRYPTSVHKLNEDAPAESVDCIGHFPPGGRLLFRVQTGWICISPPHRARMRSLGDDESRRGSLRIIPHHSLGRNATFVGSDASHGRHDDAIAQFQRPEFDWRKQPKLFRHLEHPSEIPELDYKSLR